MRTKKPNDSDFFDSHQIEFYSGSIVIGILLSWLLPTADFSAPALAFILPVLLFVTFLQVPVSKVIEGAKSGRFIAALLIGNFVFIPFLVFILFWLGGLFFNNLLGLAYPLDISRSTVPYYVFTFFGAILLCAPCVDYVVSFCRIAKGDSASLTAALPILLIIQFVFFVYFLGRTVVTGQAESVGYQKLNELLDTFLLVFVVPLSLAGILQAASYRNQMITRSVEAVKNSAVFITSVTLLIIAAYAFSEIFSIFQHQSDCFYDFGAPEGGICEHINLFGPLLYGISIYAIYACLAPVAGFLTAKLFQLNQKQAIAISFSVSTRNSLVILPLLLLISSESEKGLIAVIVLTQTIVELVAEVFYVRCIPLLVKKYFRFQEVKSEDGKQ